PVLQGGPGEVMLVGEATLGGGGDRWGRKDGEACGSPRSAEDSALTEGFSPHCLTPAGTLISASGLGLCQRWVTGLEPATTRSTVWSSNQLSYTHQLP